MARLRMPGVTPGTVTDGERRAREDVRRAQAMEQQRRKAQRATLEEQAEGTLLRFGSKMGLTADSFQNFGANLGLGTDNISSGATYGFNPITRVRTLLEWIHRGTWIGGVAIDLVAEDMTRAGVDLQATLKPEDAQKIQNCLIGRDVWGSLCDTIKWARLYGGSIGVIMIEGQDPETPLRWESVGADQFLGVWPVDRWMVEPTLHRAGLVDEFGPEFGMPKWYSTIADQAGIPRMRIHHSRVLRFEGIRLPYWQRIMENLWGISVIERIYDRMTAFDSATTGAAQLVYRSFIREYKIEGYRQVVAEGGRKLQGLRAQVDMMRRMQGIEGVTLIDTKDEFNTHGYQGFSGLSDALMQFGQQISGALQIPLVRLFGQSPAGLNATGESDLVTYYDGIRSQQERHRRSFDTLLRVVARSERVTLPEQFNWKFAPLWQLSDEKRAEVAERTTGTILAGYEQALIPQQTALKELSQQSRITGIFTNITAEQIEAADDQLAPSMEELRQEQEEKQEEAMEAGGAGMVPPGMAPKPPGAAPGAPKPPGAGNGKGEAFAGPPKPPTDAKHLMHGGKGKDAAERRLAKMEAGYIFPGNSSDTKRCAGCSMFIAGPSDINACTLVEGAIETNAVCKHFAERKADADMIAAARDDGITVSTRDGIGHIIGTDGESEAVFVIDMYGPKGTFERHQVMLGFPDQTAAIEAYNAMWPSTAKAGFAKLTPTRPGVLQRWLKHGDKGQPFSAGQSMRLVT